LGKAGAVSNHWTTTDDVKRKCQPSSLRREKTSAGMINDVRRAKTGTGLNIQRMCHWLEWKPSDYGPVR